MRIKFLIGLFITAGFFFPACVPQRTSLKPADTGVAAVYSSQLISDTLYFGMGTPQGPVTPDEWDVFLGSVVTPRFPEGLTVWDAKGQWKGKSGVIGKEKTKVLQLIHPDSPEADRAIQEIIDAYKKQFDQESVMKVRAPADVSF
jgi:hypothetical protein